VTMVYFGDDGDKSSYVFANYARTNEDVAFGLCASTDCSKHFKVSSKAIVLFKNFDEMRNDYTEDTVTADGLKAFFGKNGTPLVIAFSEKWGTYLAQKKTSTLILFRDPDSETTKQLAEYETIMTRLAPVVRSSVQLVTCGNKAQHEVKYTEFFGVTAKDFPTVRLLDQRDPRGALKKYKYDGEFTEKNLLNLVEQWKNGKLTPYLKSQDPQPNDGDVVVLTGDNFRDTVFEKSKDVLVEFYAPWCGHCKKLAPIYSEMATELKKNKNLVIAKIDATANELENVQIKGYPTLKFYPANKKSAPVDFSEDKTKENMIAFLEKYATNRLAAKEEL